MTKLNFVCFWSVLTLGTAFAFQTANADGGVSVPATEKAAYGLADWNDADRGSHRAILEIPQAIAVEGETCPNAVRVYIPWRRRDADPQNKRLILTAAENGTVVANALAARMDRESIDFVFQPIPGVRRYELYYLPHNVQPGSGFYGGGYLKPEETADADWRTQNNLTSEALSNGDWKKLPEIKLVELQARGAFESFYPMEVVAKASEKAALAERYAGRPFLLFPEDRTRPIVLTKDIPLDWVEKGPSSEFRGAAERNEYYAFQIGVWALSQPMEKLSVAFSDLTSNDANATIPASALTCFNLGGIDARGVPFEKRIDLPLDAVQPLWFGVDLATDLPAGEYNGTATIGADGLPSQTVALNLTVGENLIPDRGDNEPWRHSRLRWLNSTLGIDDNVFPPFEPLTTDGRTIRCVGRSVAFDVAGLPESIRCGDLSLLNAPVRFLIRPKNGEDQALVGRDSNVVRQTDASIRMDATGNFGDETPIDVRTETTMEFDGRVLFRIHLTANETVELDDATLEIPFDRDAVPYLMGLGQRGGYLKTSQSSPDEPKIINDWKWGGDVYNDSFWLGGPHAGVQCELRGADYCGPMVNLYWKLGQLQPPKSWFNDGRGGCLLSERGDQIVVRAYSGARTLQKGETATWEFDFLITPVKPLDTAAHFQQRYYHSPLDPKEIKKSGANVINIHHANELNLYINYPFLTVDRLSKHIRAAHDEDMKIKLYYTVRELTNHIVEWAAIRSLGTEVLGDGSGGGYPWLREHFGDRYTPQWYDRLPNGEVSAAVVTSGESRWYNYYIEGLRWMLKNLEIDGLYLDDVTYDRGILKRMRSVMEATRPGCLIDLHSNTAFSRGPANQYMEFFPYVDLLWFGESFNYDDAPDYWLTEISGIPYGLMGQMLQNGGNAWRGMLFGMTARLPWSGVVGERILQVWKIWDDFGIDQAKMIGWWEKDVPIRSKTDGVLATVYVRDGKSLLALATWNPEPVDAELEIDWAALGLDPNRTTLVAPDMVGGGDVETAYQTGATYQVGDPIPIEPGKGKLILLEEAK